MDDFKGWEIILRFLGKLGWSSFLGSGILCLIYVFFPNLFLGIQEVANSFEIIALLGGLLGTGLNGLLESLIKLIAQTSSDPLKNFRKDEKLVTRKLQILDQSVVNGYLTSDEAKKAGKDLILELISDSNSTLKLPGEINEDEENKSEL